MREPGGEYETHVTQSSGTGFDIAAEIVSVVCFWVAAIVYIVYTFMLLYR